MYYLKLYYGSEVWHLPGRSESQNKQLKYASANALRLCDPNITVFHTHKQITQNDRTSFTRPNVEIQTCTYYVQADQKPKFPDKPQPKDQTFQPNQKTKLQRW